MPDEYFPATPDVEPAKQSASKANASFKGAPARVTLSLGNLPSKKDVKSPYPRTPSKVSYFTSYLNALLTTFLVLDRSSSSFKFIHVFFVHCPIQICI